LNRLAAWVFNSRNSDDYESDEQGAEGMSATDKARNKIDDLGGKAKEAVGKGTGDDRTKNEGKLDQAKASLKDAGEKVKDTFKK
jgi:uncharacterized protein YjbJ (UPF0337 family)